jgi:hypothetical protein
MRSSLARLAVLAACLVATAAAVMPAGAAAGGYHMARPFIDNDGSSTRAVGKICTGSKYGKWRWHVTIGSGRLQASYRWIEQIHPDGEKRNLRFTYIGGQIVEDQPPELRDLFVATVKRSLNRITVKLTGGKLVYWNPISNDEYSKAFKPEKGGC